MLTVDLHVESPLWWHVESESPSMFNLYEQYWTIHFSHFFQGPLVKFCWFWWILKWSGQLGLRFSSQKGGESLRKPGRQPTFAVPPRPSKVGRTMSQKKTQHHAETKGLSIFPCLKLDNFGDFLKCNGYVPFSKAFISHGAIFRRREKNSTKKLWTICTLTSTSCILFVGCTMSCDFLVLHDHVTMIFVPGCWNLTCWNPILRPGLNIQHGSSRGTGCFRLPTLPATHGTDHWAHWPFRVSTFGCEKWNCGLEKYIDLPFYAFVRVWIFYMT